MIKIFLDKVLPAVIMILAFIAASVIIYGGNVIHDDIVAPDKPELMKEQKK